LSFQLGAYRLGRLSVGESLGLRQTAGDGEVLLGLIAARRAGGQQEIQRRTHAALVQHLEERVLAIVAGLAPDDGGGRALDRRTVLHHRLAVALHFELLQVGGEAPQRVVVRQYRERRQVE